MDLLTVAWNSLHSEPPLQPCYENKFPNASPNYYEKKELLTFQDSRFYFETVIALVW